MQGVFPEGKVEVDQPIELVNFIPPFFSRVSPEGV